MLQQTMRNDLYQWVNNIDFKTNTTHLKAFKAGWRARNRLDAPRHKEVTDRYASQILRKLAQYLPDQHIDMLRYSFGARPDITVCMTVEQIINQYNDTPDREAEVNRLLQQFLKLHFS